MKTDTADVSVCTPTFNQSAYLAEAVGSVLAQTVLPKRILVQDDASTDDTEKVLSHLIAANPCIEYRKNATNLGIAANNSRMMSDVDTEFVVRLDSDDALQPKFIEVLLTLMRTYPRAGYGSAAVLRMDGQSQPLHQVFLARRAGYQEPDEALKAAVAGYRVAGNIVIYRRAALVEMNYFRGRPDYVEDYDLAARMAAAGWGNVYSDQILSRYRVWTDPKGTRFRRKHQELSGYIRLFDEVLKPAFEKRDWPTRGLARQRRRLAIAHSNFCFLCHHDKAYHEQLVKLLRELGDSQLLELKFLLLGCGAAPLFERFYHFRGDLKVSAKRILARLRSHRPEQPTT